MHNSPRSLKPQTNAHACRVAVIWIDWYAYHVARFRGLDSAPSLFGRVVGLELVGGVGVHAGLKFRENLPGNLAIETLMPNSSWADANKLQLARQLWKRLAALDPETVLVPGYYTLPAIAAAVWAKLHGRLSVLMTESTAADHKRVAWKEWSKGLLLHTLFDWAVTGGQAHVLYLKQLGFPLDRIAGSYDVVDNAMFAEGTRALRAGNACDFGLPLDYFLYVGRFAEEKNVEALLASWLEYRRSGGAWSLVCVGDGPAASSLRAAAASTPFAADVYFPGLKSSHELLPFYAFAGAFVLPSTREPWGLVVNEAMAAALPVLVSHRCGCAPDLVHDGTNGFLFDPSNQAELTALLHRVAALSPDALTRMGGHSSEIIAGFSPQRFGSEVAIIANSAHPTAAHSTAAFTPATRTSAAFSPATTTSAARRTQ